MNIRRSKLILIFLGLSTSTSIHAEEYLSLNAGLSVSKSILGVSYTRGQNELNIGLKGFVVSNSGEYVLQPGLTYNRYFTSNGWYGSIGYAPEYRNEDVLIAKYLSPGTYTYHFKREKGWTAGGVLLGMGKNFQFTTWGVNLDGGLAVPLNRSELNQTPLSLWVGAGISYRFKLD